MATEYSEILNLLDDYFDLLYKCDVELINQLFLPNANVCNVSDDVAVIIDMDQFHERIASRISPESQNKNRDDRILSIDITCPTIALAKVDLLILPGGRYTDYLSLLKVAGNWKIASKVFHLKVEDQ
ncbi:nuclear transport factor 2 family protein [Candidatus Njordibacter sp. Uisw_058]|jgi:hypothetical protein|uniref:nuclear transport factor 2 family protein n=1 Tax=Candidatus Njordibacter sp. Uisw_058 TaxID=3230974 RepID=UPI003D4536DA|tara:strand:- start:749 stop:1129 length:381 start_codon:yes stop_codon:yes gene_type:complete